MMKKLFSKGVALLLVAMLMSGLVGCGQKDSGDTTSTTGTTEKAAEKTDTKATDSEEKITIRLAHTYTGSDAKAPLFAAVLQKFKDEHPNIEIVEETTSGDEIRTKIKVDLASGNLPDIITYWGGAILKPLVDNDQILDISEYLKLSKTLKREDISDAAWQFYTYGDTTYGVPMEGYMSAFICNKSIFEKYGLSYPKTEADLLAVAKVFNENDVVPLAIGSKGGNPSHFYYSELYNQLAGGTEEINGMGTSNQFATDNALKVAQIIDEQRLAGVYPEDTIANGDWSPSFELYNSGNAAMVYTYPWMIGGMSEEITAVSEIIPVPAIDGAAKDSSKMIQSSSVFGMVINKESFNSNKQAAIVELMDCLTSAEMQTELFKAGAIPTRNMELDLSAVHPMLKTLFEYSEGLEKVPAHFNTITDDDSFSYLQNTLDELFSGAVTPEEFVEKVQSAFEKAKSK